MHGERESRTTVNARLRVVTRETRRLTFCTSSILGKPEARKAAQARSRARIKARFTGPITVCIIREKAYWCNFLCKGRSLPTCTQCSGLAQSSDHKELHTLRNLTLHYLRSYSLHLRNTHQHKQCNERSHSLCIQRNISFHRKVQCSLQHK